MNKELVALVEPTPEQWQEFYERVWDSDESNPTLALPMTELQRIGRALLSALTSSVEGTDMVQVPVEPTEAMLRAAKEERWKQSKDGDEFITMIYRAMLSARPVVPTGEE